MIAGTSIEIQTHNPRIRRTALRLKATEAASARIARSVANSSRRLKTTCRNRRSRHARPRPQSAPKALSEMSPGGRGGEGSQRCAGAYVSRLRLAAAPPTAEGGRKGSSSSRASRGRLRWGHVRRGGGGGGRAYLCRMWIQVWEATQMSTVNRRPAPAAEASMKAVPSLGTEALLHTLAERSRLLPQIPPLLRA